MRTKITVIALIAVTAGMYVCMRPLNAMPPNQMDAAADFNIAIPVLEKDKGEVPVPKPVAVEDVAKVNNSSSGAPSKPLEWVFISGGKFTMGTESFQDAKPLHQVTIRTFNMSKTAVTVEQYAECVIKGGCTAPGSDAAEYCNWGKTGRELHPVNCVTWAQANQYAKFKSARLPSEAEWEYAARSGGKDQNYPWGNEAATCDKAVMKNNAGYGCGAMSTLPVCSKPAGNTAQGLCDMAGNVWQWVQDKFQLSYEGAPVDGSAFEDAGVCRGLRGGAFSRNDARELRAGYRNFNLPGIPYGDVGFRLARSSQ